MDEMYLKEMPYPEFWGHRYEKEKENIEFLKPYFVQTRILRSQILNLITIIA